jgi:hypothetical protein
VQQKFTLRFFTIGCEGSAAFRLCQVAPHGAHGADSINIPFNLVNCVSMSLRNVGKALDLHHSRSISRGSTGMAAPVPSRL